MRGHAGNSAAWGEADPVNRMADLQQACAPDVTYVDPTSMSSDLAGRSQSYPHGFRIAWNITGATPAHGTFAGSLAVDGRIAEVTEFDGDPPPP